MKSDHQFKVERVLARHCDALIARGPAPRDPKAIVQDFAEAASRQISKAMLPLLGGAAIKLAPAELSEGSMSGWRESVAGDSKAIALSGPAGRPEMLLAVDLSSAMILTDIAFGGTGEPPKSLPEEWPSASISVAEALGKNVAGALANTLDYSAPLSAATPWQSFAKVAFLCGANELLWTRFAPADPNDGSWSIALALPARHAKIVDANAAPQTASDAPKASPAKPPFNGIPLPARCELAQIRLPIGRAAKLNVGDVFPIAIPRDVPIEIAGRTVARGAIGALDDRVAIEVTQLGLA